MGQTDSCKRGGRRGNWMKCEGIGQRTSMHNLRHGQQCGDGQREGGGSWMEVGKVGGMQTSIIVSTIKIKLKKLVGF